MGVIEFRARDKGALSRAFMQTLPNVSSGPKPNFEDPHSRDFLPEPVIDKTLCDFLNPIDQQKLNRFLHERGFKAEFEDNTISLSKIARFADKNGAVQSLHQSKPSYLPVAEITCFDNEAGQRTHYAYKLHHNDEGQALVGFNSLLITLGRHLDTGSPTLPEPEIWR